MIRAREKPANARVNFVDEFARDQPSDVTVDRRVRTRVLAEGRTHVRVPSRRSSELSARLQQVAFKTRTFRTPAYFRFSLSTTPAPFLLRSSLAPSPSFSLARSVFHETKIGSQIFRTDVSHYSRNCSFNSFRVAQPLRSIA